MFARLATQFFFKGDWIIEVVSGVYRAVAV
jgi:hypothetical protein